MKIIHGLDSMRKERNPVILAAGFFDGLHRGHQRIINIALKAEEIISGSVWVMTFDTHPLKVLHPEKAPLLLTSTSHKLKLLKSLGVRGCVVIPFTRELSRIKPNIFIKTLNDSIPKLQLICVGRNWTFGRDGSGTADALKELARRLYSLKVRVIPPVCYKGEPISSTRIRSDISSGRLGEAMHMLGRPPSVLGTVIKGRGVGTRIGVPTANIDPHNEAYPPDGVYAAQAIMGGKIYPGILNLGSRPTLNAINRSLNKIASRNTRDSRKSAQRVLELHVFDMQKNLYRKHIEIQFLKKLRDEQQFNSIDALKQQIGDDIRQARIWLHQKKSRRSF